MKKIILILLILISNNLLAQDVLTESFGSVNLETLNDSFSKKDLLKIEENKTQIARGSNPRNNRFGVNINMGSPTLLLSASLDYFITSSVNIEAGIGLFGAFGGMKYHFSGSKNTANWTPYLGLFYGANLSLETDTYTNLYVPLGLQYTGSKGFVFAVEIAGIFVVKELNDYSSFFPNSSEILISPVWGAIKLGYHI